MVDHIRTLLLNPEGTPGYRKVSDAPSDKVLTLFGFSGKCQESDEALADALVPLALCADLAEFRTAFDGRVSPPHRARSVYRSVYCDQECTDCTAVSLDGLHDRVFGQEGRWALAPLFQHDDPSLMLTLSSLRSCTRVPDGPYALGAVLIACALRRLFLQGEGI